MIKINTLSVENVKRVKAVKIEPAQNGLTIIGFLSRLCGGQVKVRGG